MFSTMLVMEGRRGIVVSHNQVDCSVGASPLSMKTVQHQGEALFNRAHKQTDGAFFNA